MNTIKYKTTFLGLLISLVSFSQTITIQPYLQDASPNSIKVMWETSSGEESVVEYGLTPKLGKTEKGTAKDINYTSKRVHTVQLKGLKRFTEYYYRVKTGNVVSDVFQFKTPPFASDRKSFNILAMSDMQYDYNQPNKFKEVINDGILKYLKKEYKGNIPSNIAMVMIPGDLVENGAVFHQWKNHFFNPAEKLFSQVPIYPVLGNHENNSVFYIKYFELPKNGTPAYEDHWWYKDYGNTRIIGLNSNKFYAENSIQLNWLKDVLKKTAKNNDIDFVFAQMHHPHKSELWIPGESDFSGKVVKLLEEFSTKTGKPSIHFFGHTHGYSRGQSKEHKHLWVNVASAGGAIDNWGEFKGRDYDEFTVTQDEYGFVMMEVSGDKENPKFTLKRISRGNTIKGRDNEVTDSITVYKKTEKPNAPKCVQPINSEENIFGVTLKASEFKSGAKNAFHAASQWQVSETQDFSKPIFDSWKQHENWYYLENRQKNDDLTDEKLDRLKPNKTYYWKVRYRDQYLNWSDWSTVSMFKTKY